MQFEITPSSGYDNSYYDIHYEVLLNENLSDQSHRLFFINKATNERLHILATSVGYINSEGYVVIEKPVKKLEGYFDLFNNDKMNVKLENYPQVEVECVIEGKSQISQSTLFFNESFSIDQGIVPFHLAVENKTTIDLSKQEPLRLTVIADAERSFHLVIDTLHVNIQYDFYIFTKKGQLHLEIPPEVLYHELNLYKMSNIKFRICYMKKHGVNYNNVINEKKVPISDTEFQFVNHLKLHPQTRLDPIERELSYSDFLPSDRYFVPTWHEYSFYSRLRKDPVYVFYDSLMTDEFIQMRQLYDKAPGLPPTNTFFWRKEENRPVKEKTEPSSKFYNTMNTAYSHRADTVPYADQLKTASIPKVIPKGGSGCADCARKRQQRLASQRTDL